MAISVCNMNGDEVLRSDVTNPSTITSLTPSNITAISPSINVNV